MRNFSRLGKVISAGMIVSMLAACDSGTASPAPAANVPTTGAGAGAAATDTTGTAAGVGSGSKSNYVIAMSRQTKQSRGVRR